MKYFAGKRRTKNCLIVVNLLSLLRRKTKTVISFVVV